MSASRFQTSLFLATAWIMPSVFAICPISVSCHPIIRSRHAWSTHMTTKAVTIIEEIEKDNGSFDAVAFSQQTLSSSEALAAVFDHTLLKAEATREQVIRLCEEAAECRFACAMESGMGEHGVYGACGQR